MLLRSSSTPVLGSLLSSFPNSPNKDFDNNNKHPSSSDHNNHSKLSFSHGGHLNFSPFSCNSSSPISHSHLGFSELDRESISFGQRGFRRARSDGNLQGLAGASCDIDEQASRTSRRPNNSKMLQKIPSFSLYNTRGGFEDEEDVEKEGFGEGDGVLLQRSVTIGDNITAIGSGEFSFDKKNMDLIVEEEEEGQVELCNLGFEEGVEQQVNPPMYLARGLGIDVGSGFGGGDCFNPAFSGDGGQEGTNVETYYKRMVEENPCNPLFLRNYAQFLYQSKGDLQGAEEYYSLAILADPADGEILTQYAKLVWELHQDQERASIYFEQAVQATPEDSHVLAAYASFLWETEDNEEEQDSTPQNIVLGPVFHEKTMASASA